MADIIIDEDAPINSLSSNPHTRESAEDHDPTDEGIADYRFLSSAISNTKLPKRGEKDFEQHGTRAQDGVLEQSRQAMHEALSFTRVHMHGKHKGSVRGWYFGDAVEGADICMGEDIRGKGLGADHIVMVEVGRGPMFKGMGQAGKGMRDFQTASLWLLPEEALYLVERGDMDLYWPMNPLGAVRGEAKSMEEQEDMDDEEADIPLSLQAAWSLLVGQAGEVGKVGMEQYTVYANLKRTGYIVLRATEEDLLLGDVDTTKPFNVFTWLFGAYFNYATPRLLPDGPLVRPGLYRSYEKMYRQLSIIPRHQPSALPANPISPYEPYKIHLHVYKTSRVATFAKSSPGVPDFRIAIIPARDSTVPSLKQLTSLLESTPFDPPNPEWKGDAKSYQRLKHGYRNCIMAVVDQGVISYLRMAEGAFGEEMLTDRFDRTAGGRGGRGGKRGGFRGRGRGRGKR